MSASKVDKNSLSENLKNWQVIEDDSIRNTTEIIKRSENPILHIIMEIIRQDSVMHRRVQQLIIDSIEKDNFRLTSEELTPVWDLIQEHNELEKKAIQSAEELVETTNSIFIKYLLEYLITDEKKHDKLLEKLEKIKKEYNTKEEMLK